MPATRLWWRTLALLLSIALPADGGEPAPSAATGGLAPSTDDPAFEFDLLVKGGRVIDGTGAPAFEADVGIREGRIAKVAPSIEAAADHVIDAAGMVIAPGFIDLHSHAYDGLIDSDPRRWTAPNLVSQGITTVVLNPDGFGPLSVARQRSMLERRRFAPNAILMVAHNTIRAEVLKEGFRRAATDREIAAMRRLVVAGMRSGAFGLTAGLEYSPGIWSTSDELVALVEPIVAFDGVFIAHERSSGADPMWYVPSRADAEPTTMLDFIDELIGVADRTGARVVATHIKARGVRYWGKSAEIIGRIRQARARGLAIFADQYPYDTSGSDGRLRLAPRWTFSMADSDAAPAGRDDRPDDRSPEHGEASRRGALRGDIEHEIARRGGADRIVVIDHPDRRLVGKSLADVAAARGVSPVEMALRWRRGGTVDGARPPTLRGFSLSEDDVQAFAREPWTATATDGWIVLPGDAVIRSHPRCYGTFPRKIRRYALEKGLMSVEAAIRSATALPAEILGIHARGRVREGLRADLVILDLDRLADRSTVFDPHRHSDGIEHVLVRGIAVVKNGRITGALPGRVLAREPIESGRLGD